MNLPEHRFKPPNNAQWPSNCTDDQWIKEQIERLPHAWRKGTCAKYSSVYLEEGRYAANTRLREMVVKFGN